MYLCDFSVKLSVRERFTNFQVFISGMDNSDKADFEIYTLKEKPSF